MPLNVSCRAILFVAGCGAEAVGALFFVANRIIAGRKAAVGNIGAGADIVVADAGIDGGAIVVLRVDAGAIRAGISRCAIAQRPSNAFTRDGVTSQYYIGPFWRLAIAVVRARVAVLLGAILLTATFRTHVSAPSEISAAALFADIDNVRIRAIPDRIGARHYSGRMVQYFPVDTLIIRKTVTMAVWIIHTFEPFQHVPSVTDTVGSIKPYSTNPMT
jgi:hypothetical protein